MNSPVSYAELYTKEERNSLLRRYALIIVLVMLPGYIWGLPELEFFMRTAHCQTIAGVHGLVVLMYGMYAGLPLLFAVVLQLVLTWQAYRIIRDRQSPPKNVKVFYKTRVYTGREAVMRGVFMILIIPAMFVFIINWGLLQAERMVQGIDLNQLDYSLCVNMHDEHL